MIKFLKSSYQKPQSFFINVYKYVGMLSIPKPNN